MEYCLIETWQDDYCLPTNCRAVALTTEAGDQLKKGKIDYNTFDDFFPSSEVLGDTSSYLESQHIWFRKFDEFLQNVFPEAKKMDVKLASLYSYNIKYLVDNVILTSRIINRFIDEVKPSKIWFISKIYGADIINRRRWFYYGKSSFVRLIEPICRQKGIPCACLYSKNADLNSCEARQKTIKKDISIKVKSFIKIVKEFCIQYLYLIVWPNFKRSSRTNMLILRANSYIYKFCKDCRKVGFEIYFKRENNIYKRALFPKNERLNYDNLKSVGLSTGADYASILYDLMHNDITLWVHERCGIDVSFVLEDGLRHFIYEVFPRTLIRIRELANYYDEKKIDYVVSLSLDSEDDYAGVAAASVSKNTKSVGFAHGADAFDGGHKFINEYSHYDFYFSCTAGEVDNIKRMAKMHANSRLYVDEYPYFRDRYSKMPRIKKVLYKWDKPVVVFAPIMRNERMNLPIINAQILQWDYLKWHYALIDYFSSRSDYNFVWKAILNYLRPCDTIIELISNKNSGNISFSTTDLNKWLSVADRTLFDVPSTAFFNAIFLKLPTLGFYRPNDQKLYEDAYRIFGPSLQARSNIEDGLRIIEEYLDSEPNKYIVSLPQNKVFIPEILHKSAQLMNVSAVSKIQYQN